MNQNYLLSRLGMKMIFSLVVVSMVFLVILICISLLFKYHDEVSEYTKELEQAFISSTYLSQMIVMRDDNTIENELKSMQRIFKVDYIYLQLIYDDHYNKVFQVGAEPKGDHYIDYISTIYYENVMEALPVAKIRLYKNKKFIYQSLLKHLTITLLSGGIAVVCIALILGFLLMRLVIVPLATIVFFVRRLDFNEVQPVLNLPHSKIFRKYDEMDELIETIRTMQLRLNKQHRDIVALNNQKNVMISVIGHDLKSPFTALLGMANIMMNHDMDTKTLKAHAQTIYRSSHKIYQLLDRLLQWACLGKLNSVRNDLGEVITRVVDVLQASAQIKDIQLMNHVETGKYFVNFDSGMLETVIRNLVNNGIKFTEKQGKVGLLARFGEDQKIFLEIEDTGIGISPEIQEKLLFPEKGKVVSQKGTENEQGTGLGLLLCFEMMKQNRSQFILESIVGKGSKFILIFPHNE